MTHHPSFGAVLEWDPAGGTAWSTIAQVKDISGPNISRGDIDVTDHDLEGVSSYRVFLPGIPDPGDLTFTIGWDPNDGDHQQAVGTGLLADFENNACSTNLAAFRLTPNMCGGTAIWTFDGYLNSWTANYPTEGENTADVGIKISGKPTLTVT